MHIVWQHFSKKTLGLIAVLLIITGGLLFLAIREDQPQQKVSLSPAPTLSPAHATLSLVPEISSSSAVQQVNIIATSNENKISGAQLNLSYDPKILTNIAIKPGSYFKSPTILFNSIDKVNGRITYVLAIQPTGTQASGSGVVATISYTLVPTASTSTNLIFLPKTEVTQIGILGSVLKKASNLLIPIPANLRLSPTPKL